MIARDESRNATAIKKSGNLNSDTDFVANDYCYTCTYFVMLHACRLSQSLPTKLRERIDARMTRGEWGQVECTVGFNARLGSRSGRVACANIVSGSRFTTRLVYRCSDIARHQFRGENIECACDSAMRFQSFNCAPLEAREMAVMYTVRDLVLCSWRRHKCVRAIASRYLLHGQLVA